MRGWKAPAGQSTPGSGLEAVKGLTVGVWLVGGSNGFGQNDHTLNCKTALQNRQVSRLRSNYIPQLGNIPARHYGALFAKSWVHQLQGMDDEQANRVGCGAGFCCVWLCC